jgi:hypothetical protein
MSEETTYIYEIRDTTEDVFYSLGVFSSIEKSREFLEDDEPPEADGTCLEEHCIMGIVERSVDNIRQYEKTIEEHVYAQNYNEATDKEDWLKTDIIVNFRR